MSEAQFKTTEVPVTVPSKSLLKRITKRTAVAAVAVTAVALIVAKVKSSDKDEATNVANTPQA